MRPAASPRLLRGLAVVVFVITLAYRFLTMGGQLGGFENDDFLSIANAQQLAMGDRPIRDYFEHGFPLQELLGAASFQLLGPTLFSQFVVAAAAIALSTAILFLLAARVSGSVAVAFALALLQIGMAPRYYNYPKVLAYAIAIPALWAYIARPDRRRLWVVAAAGVVAFLLRHDHGAYVAVAGLAAVALTRRTDIRKAGIDILTLGGMALLLVSPYLLWVVAHQNPIEFVRSTLLYGERQTVRTSSRELPSLSFDLSQPLMATTAPVVSSARINVQWRQGLDEKTRVAREQALGLMPDNAVRPDVWNYRLNAWDRDALNAIVFDPLVVTTEGIDRSAMAIERPAMSRRGAMLDAVNRARILPGIISEENARAFLYYAFVLAPLGVLLLAGLRLRAAGWTPWTVAMIVSSLLALMVIAGLLRANIGARLADVSELVGIAAAFLFGALLARRSRAGRLLAASVTAVILLFAALNVQAIEHVTQQLAKTGFDKGSVGMARHAGDVYRTLTAVPPVAAWDRRESKLVEFAAYVSRCTRDKDRIVVLGYLPEVFVLAHRAFGAGEAYVLPDYFSTEADQQLIIARFRQHRVPLVLAPNEPAYTNDYPDAMPILHKFLQAEYEDAGDTAAGAGFRVLVPKNLPLAGVDPDLELPCFVPVG